MKTIATFIFISFLSFSVFAQNHTLGLLKADNSKTFKGYNLIFPLDQSNCYLLDNCGRIVHTWPDAANTRPGNLAYLQNDGSIIKAKRSAIVTGNPIYAGGAGGTIERKDWNNNLLWTFTLNDSFSRLHHDFQPMPNGHILMISWEKKTAAQAIAQGRNPAFVANGEIWPDKIIEVKPIGKDSFNIVWEWHLWDHLVQNFDSTKPNYGNPANFPGRVDLNYGGAGSAKNWDFLNAIHYNAELDQIVVSSPSINEIWIIDHSTTTLEAATSKGGKSKQGGDLIYRWGNPAAYNSGTSVDQKLFFQHDIHWMSENMADPNYGKLALFNNRVNAKYSTVNIFKPVFDKTSWTYLKQGSKFLPVVFDWTYKRPDSASMCSQIVSGVQRLPNGNTLICSGQQGYTFEITPTNEVVWEYVTPFKAGNVAKQGDTLKLAENNTFRVTRYATDFPAFMGKDLSPKGFIELDPDTAFCKISVGINKIGAPVGLRVYPNPANSTIHFETTNGTSINNATLYSITGKMIISSKDLKNKPTELDISQIPEGFYFLSINDNRYFQKLEVRH